MGHKIFVSYKYNDSNVRNLNWFTNSTVRDYVDVFQNKMQYGDDINKGEENDEDLSKLSDDTIWSKLKDRIYDSSVTVVFISPNMKESKKRDRNQWIPWEISYSLKEITRKTKTGKSITSRSNAMLAVVLPDSNGSYEYYLESCSCLLHRCISHQTDKLFAIMRNNMFNLKNATTRNCNSHGMIWTSPEHSYIASVKWDDFIYNYRFYIDAAFKRQDNINNYEICKDV